MTTILIAPHRLLRQKSRALNNIAKGDIDLSKKMIKIMKKHTQSHMMVLNIRKYILRFGPKITLPIIPKYGQLHM